jgi:hypothetical protein
MSRLHRAALFPVKPFVTGAVVFPDGAELDLTDVPVNEFAPSSAGVFNLSTLERWLAEAAMSGKPSRYTPEQAAAVAKWIRGRR